MFFLSSLCTITSSSNSSTSSEFPLGSIIWNSKHNILTFLGQPSTHSLHNPLEYIRIVPQLLFEWSFILLSSFLSNRRRRLSGHLSRFRVRRRRDEMLQRVLWRNGAIIGWLDRVRHSARKTYRCRKLREASRIGSFQRKIGAHRPSCQRSSLSHYWKWSDRVALSKLSLHKTSAYTLVC